MTEHITHELFVFTVMLASGAAAGLLFDFLRAFRMEAKPNGTLTAVTDALFWLTAIFGFSACIWNFNSGQLRFYEPLGILLGAALYFLLAGKWILMFFRLIWKNILKFIKVIFKILLTPARFLYKILLVPAARFIRGLLERMKRRPENKKVKKIKTHRRRIGLWKRTRKKS